jgi:hypothetical protein
VIDNHAWVGDGDVPTWRRILGRLAELDPVAIVREPAQSARATTSR